MEKITVTVTNRIGLHARPASLLANLLKSYESAIVFCKNGDETKTHNPRSVLSTMESGALRGDALTFTAEGKDEKQAIETIGRFITEGCGES
jgi:phosphotransferase system HPr (HPr) family protein